MKLTEDQIVTINEAGMGCSIIKTGCSPDAADDKTLPTNAYLLELKKDDETWFDIVMGESVGIFDTYYDMFGNVMQKMSYTKGTRSPATFNNPLSPLKPRPKKKKK
tara:strand:- start:216 stop:533 length:318 start_codon:yes stop_codon:yes gene_type:complete